MVRDLQLVEYEDVVQLVSSTHTYQDCSLIQPNMSEHRHDKAIHQCYQVQSDEFSEDFQEPKGKKTKIDKKL